jgi:hypothetical protein
MGGYGSGQWQRPASKRLVEHAICLDINYLARRRLLVVDCCKRINWTTPDGEVAWAEVFLGEDPASPMLFVELHRPSDESEDGGQFAIRLDSTPQHFGGSRRWLCCCLCGRRAAKLYLPPGECNFACRTCHALTYQSVKTAHQVERAWASIGQFTRRMFGDPSGGHGN